MKMTKIKINTHSNLKVTVTKSETSFGIQIERDLRHGLHTTSDDNIAMSQHNRLSSQHNRFHSWRTNLKIISNHQHFHPFIFTFSFTHALSVWIDDELMKSWDLLCWLLYSLSWQEDPHRWQLVVLETTHNSDNQKTFKVWRILFIHNFFPVHGSSWIGFVHVPVQYLLAERFPCTLPRLLPV